jgi:hypothetical protein
LEDVLTKAAWVFALLTLGALIVVIAARGEIAEVVQLFRHVRLTWLLVALALQSLTYVLAAAVWHLALHGTTHRQPMSVLIKLSLAMLFSNQAVPSVGISGGLVVVNALVQRHVPEAVAMSALLLGLVTTYIAFLVSFGIAIVWASSFSHLFALVLAAGCAFFLMAAGVTALVFNSKRLSATWRRRLGNLPLIGSVAAAVITASADEIRGAALFKATWLQLVEIILDAATLAVSLEAVGWHAPVTVVFCSYVIAAIGSRVAVAPLGIGTFEAACVTMLHAGLVPLEPALAGTLLFRGFTLWLPMIPGLLSARRALSIRA